MPAWTEVFEALDALKYWAGSPGFSGLPVARQAAHRASLCNSGAYRRPVSEAARNPNSIAVQVSNSGFPRRTHAEARPDYLQVFRSGPAGWRASSSHTCTGGRSPHGVLPLDHLDPRARAARRVDRPRMASVAPPSSTRSDGAQRAARRAGGRHRAVLGATGSDARVPVRPDPTSREPAPRPGRPASTIRRGRQG
jgi:hypothetical protein